MAFLKHPDSPKILNTRKGSTRYHELLSRGYYEPAMVGKTIYAESHKKVSYPLERPASDLRLTLQYCPDLTPGEKDTIRAVIHILDHHVAQHKKVIL